ncbi:MAG: PEP-CTERM sorting domain-containing protein [Planctomycetota bacterium]
MHRHIASIAILAGVAGGLTSAARGDDYTFSYSSISVCGHGMLSAISNGDGSLSVMSGQLFVTSSSAAGSYDLIPNKNGRAAVLSPSGFFIVDNQLFPIQNTKMNVYGLLFGNGKTEVNIWGNGDGNPYTFYAHGKKSGDVSSHGSFALSSVPAPGAAVLMTAGCLTMGLRRRRE